MLFLVTMIKCWSHKILLCFFEYKLSFFQMLLLFLVLILALQSFHKAYIEVPHGSMKLFLKICIRNRN